MGSGMRVGGSLTEYLQGRFLRNDARDVCDQLVNPLNVFVRGCGCEKESRARQGRLRDDEREPVIRRPSYWALSGG